MKKHIIIIFLISLISCKNRDVFVLEIVTKKINCLNVRNDYHNYFFSDTICSKAKTILVYKLTNNSDKSYYFNLDGYNRDLESKCIKMDNAYVKIFDDKNEIVKPHSSSATFGSILPNNLEILNQMGYNFTRKYKNFIIHPHETLYFEWFIVLPYGNNLEYNSYWLKLEAEKKYFAEILINSNGKDYEKEISRTDLQTIKENGYEVFNGTIKSKNKVPIVLNEPN